MNKVRDYKICGKFNRFTVYDNKTDMPVIVCGTAVQCASVMDISINTFYQIAMRDRDEAEKISRYGNRWKIIREFLDEDELDDYNR